MSAYVVVEATVLDEESRRRYGSLMEPILREFNGEVLPLGRGKSYPASPRSTTA